MKTKKLMGLGVFIVTLLVGLSIMRPSYSNTDNTEEILSKAIEKQGGLEAIRNLDNIMRRESFHTDRESGVDIIYCKGLQGERFRMERIVDGGPHIVYINNNGETYITQIGKETADENYVSEFKRWSEVVSRSLIPSITLLNLFDRLERNEGIEYSGIEVTARGEDCFVIIADTAQPGLELHYFIDTDTYLLCKTEIRKNNAISAEVYFSDFKSVQGLTLPFLIENYGASGKEAVTRTIREYSFVEIPEDLFSIPEP